MNHESDADMDHLWLHTEWIGMSVSCEQMDNGCKHVIISLCDMQLVHLLVMDAERIIKARFSTVHLSCSVFQVAKPVNAGNYGRKSYIMSNSCNETIYTEY